MEIDYSLLPPHMHGAMKRYIEQGIEPGSFLVAVLSNDMMEACARADSVNRNFLPDYAMFLYNYAPRGCYGSKEKVIAWVERRGLEGFALRGKETVK